MAFEDFLTYTEVDPATYIGRTSSRVTFTGIPQTADAYVYKDKGVDHFSGNFEHLLAIYDDFTSGPSWPYLTFWCLANIIDDFYGIYSGSSEDALAFYGRARDDGILPLSLTESYAGSLTSDGYTGSQETVYYLKIKRDEGVGTYGTLYCYIYSDADRTNLLDTLSVALHEEEDFRYIYCIQNWNTGVTGTQSGYAENLDLQEETVTYHFDGYSAAEAWETNPDKMADGDEDVYASTASNGNIELLNTNTCPGTNLGSILSVEIRAKAHGDGDDQIYLRPVFSAGDGPDHAITPSAGAGAWSSWINITNDANAPDWSSWQHVADLDMDVEFAKVAKANTMYCSKVEIRVSYTPTVGPVEAIAARTFPMVYLSKPVKAQELRSKVEGATVTRIASDFPLELCKAGKAQELRSRWS